MDPRNSNRPAERDWRPFKYLILGMAVMAIVLSLPARGGSRAIVHRTDVKVRAAQSCERNLDRDRAPHATRRLYSSSTSMPFRRWAYQLWRGRAAHCQATTAYLNAVPPRAIRYVFARIGQAATAIAVASHEAGSGDIDRHPFCTRTTNGQYLGCFQMGEWARDKYGHGPTALDQAWAALRYVVDARGWCSGWSATAPGC